MESKNLLNLFIPWLKGLIAVFCCLSFAASAYSALETYYSVPVVSSYKVLSQTAAAPLPSVAVCLPYDLAEDNARPMRLTRASLARRGIAAEEVIAGCYFGVYLIADNDKFGYSRVPCDMQVERRFFTFDSGQCLVFKNNFTSVNPKSYVAALSIGLRYNSNLRGTLRVPGYLEENRKRMRWLVVPHLYGDLYWSKWTQGGVINVNYGERFSQVVEMFILDNLPEEMQNEGGCDDRNDYDLCMAGYVERLINGTDTSWGDGADNYDQEWYPSQMLWPLTNCPRKCRSMDLRVRARGAEDSAADNATAHEGDAFLVVKFPMHYTHVASQYAFTTQNMIGNIGGQLGLWLGVSILDVSSIIGAVTKRFGLQ